MNKEDQLQQLILESDSIRLRPIVIEDASTLLLATQDPMIRKLTHTTSNFSIEQIEAFIKKSASDASRYDFAICLKDGTMIGDLAIMDIDHEHESAEFRIALNNMSTTHQGYGTQAISLMLDFVFNTLKLNRIQLEVFSFNPHAQKAYKKVGFKVDGHLREALKVDDQYYDIIIMSLLASDYYTDHKHPL